MNKARLNIAPDKLVINDGRIDWLPKNPRRWTQKDIDRCCASIERDPDFMEERPILALPLEGGKYLVFCHNLLTTGAKRLKLKTAPAVIYFPETDEDRETVKRRAMLDNGSFGSWDYDELANKWDDLPLVDLGIPAWEPEQPDVNPDDFGTEFSLPDGDKSDFCTMSFQVSTRQRDLIEKALADIKKTAAYDIMETDGNNNSNGNALALIIEQYGTLQRDSD